MDRLPGGPTGHLDPLTGAPYLVTGPTLRKIPNDYTFTQRPCLGFITNAGWSQGA